MTDLTTYTVMNKTFNNVSKNLEISENLWNYTRLIFCIPKYIDLKHFIQIIKYKNVKNVYMRICALIYKT